MAESPADKSNVFQPFSDIVGGQRDEGYVNLSNDIRKKIDVPTGSNKDSILIFNASTGRYEASTLSTLLNPLLSSMLGYQRATATADVTVTATTRGTANGVTGASITVPAGGAGVYRISGIWDMDWTVVSAGIIAIGTLYLNGVAATGGGDAESLLTCLGTATRITIGETWVLTLAAGDIVDIRAYKTAAAGTLIARGGGTSAKCLIDLMRISF